MTAYYHRMHQLLFSQFQLGGRSLKNRVFAEMPVSFLARENGSCSTEMIQFYERIAASDTAMIITESASVSRNKFHSLQLLGNENDSVQGLSQIAEKIRQQGATPILHLTHPGINAIPEPGTGKVFGPSAVSIPKIKNLINELSYNQIRQISGFFIESAVSAWNAGFSGLQISAADGSLFQQFLSPITNLRRDDYGFFANFGCKFIQDTFKAIRKAVPDLLLIFKMAARDLLPGGKSIENSIFLARLVANSGADAIHVVSGFPLGKPEREQPLGKNSPDGVFADDAAIIKNSVDIPILVSGKISTPEIGEKILQDGKADAVILGRTLLRDLDWLFKSRMNSESIKIRRCLHCIVCSAASHGCPDFDGITIWNLNLNKYLKGKNKS